MILKTYSRGIIVPVLIILSYPFEIYSLDFMSVRIRLSDVVILLSIIYLSYLFLLKKAPVSLDLVSGFLFLYIMASVASILSDPTAQSLIGILYFFVVFFAYFTVINLIRDSSDVNLVAKVIVYISVIIAFYGVMEFCFYVFLGQKMVPFLCDSCVNQTYGYAGGLMRPRAFFYSYNRLGGYLIPGLILSLHYYLSTLNKKYFYYFLILFLGVAFSLSRSAHLGACIALLIYFLSRARVVSVSKFIKNIVGSVVIVVIVGLIVLLYPEKELINRYNPLAQSDSDQASSLDIFINHLLAAIQANIETLFIGSGVQMFDDYALSLDYVSVWGSHSNFIYFLGESGILGILSHLLIILSLFVMFVNVLDFSSHKKYTILFADSILFLALFSSFVGVLITGIFRTYYYNPYSFVIIALITSQYRSMFNKKYVYSYSMS